MSLIMSLFLEGYRADTHLNQADKLRYNGLLNLKNNFHSRMPSKLSSKFR